MANSFFRFKQFTIQQEKAAMKVTTDACLFGAITAEELYIPGSHRALDIGTGTGLLSLMYAQKNPSAQVDAVELEAAAAEQAQSNVTNSIFASRVHVHYTDIKNFTTAFLYERIFCNPPFYSHDLKGPDEKKNLAHHNTGLLLPELFIEIKRLIAPGGKFGILLPASKAESGKQLAAEQGWSCYKNFILHQSGEHAAFRNILFFSKEKLACEEIILKIKAGEEYSPAFKNFLSSYYLNL